MKDKNENETKKIKLDFLKNKKVITIISSILVLSIIFTTVFLINRKTKPAKEPITKETESASINQTESETTAFKAIQQTAEETAEETTDETAANTEWYEEYYEQPNEIYPKEKSVRIKSLSETDQKNLEITISEILDAYRSDEEQPDTHDLSSEEEDKINHLFNFPHYNYQSDNAHDMAITVLFSMVDMPLLTKAAQIYEWKDCEIEGYYQIGYKADPLGLQSSNLTFSHRINEKYVDAIIKNVFNLTPTHKLKPLSKQIHTSVYYNNGYYCFAETACQDPSQSIAVMQSATKHSDGKYTFYLKYIYGDSYNYGYIDICNIKVVAKMNNTQYGKLWGIYSIEKI